HREYVSGGLSIALSASARKTRDSRRQDDEAEEISSCERDFPHLLLLDEARYPSLVGFHWRRLVRDSDCGFGRAYLEVDIQRPCLAYLQLHAGEFGGLKTSGGNRNFICCRRQRSEVIVAGGGRFHTASGAGFSVGDGDCRIGYHRRGWIADRPFQSASELRPNVRRDYR